MAKLERDPGADLDELRFVIGIGKESASAGHSRDFFQNRTAKSRERIARIFDAYSVDLNVGFFDPLAQLVICIPAVIVLPIRDNQQRFFWDVVPA